MNAMALILRKIIGDPETIPLEHRVFNIAAIVGVFMCTTSVVLNLYILESMIVVVAPFIMLVMTIFLYYLSAYRKRHILASYAALSLLTFGLYPVIWIGNGGSFGPVFMYYLLNGMLIPFLLQDGRKLLMMVLNLMVLLGLYGIEYLYPSQIELYNSIESRLLDHGVSFIVLFIVVYFLTQSVMNEYRIKVDQLNEVQKILKYKSERDALTGIYNRGYIMEALADEVGKESSGSMALIMLDIDDFKHINDKFGHQWGDRVIIDVANRVTSSVRKTDVVGRIGGEEFLVFLNDCDFSVASKIAEEMRQSIEALKWSEEKLTVTASFGVAVYKYGYRKDGVTTEKMLNKADALMYNSKRTGKNKVCIDWGY